MHNAELEGLLPPFFGAGARYWIGEVLGCWLALRRAGYSNASLTAAWLAVLAPIVVLLLPLLGGLVVVILIALPLLARGLANMMRKP